MWVAFLISIGIFVICAAFIVYVREKVTHSVFSMGKCSYFAHLFFLICALSLILYFGACYLNPDSWYAEEMPHTILIDSEYIHPQLGGPDAPVIEKYALGLGYDNADDFVINSRKSRAIELVWITGLLEIVIVLSAFMYLLFHNVAGEFALKQCRDR